MRTGRRADLCVVRWERQNGSVINRLHHFPTHCLLRCIFISHKPVGFSRRAGQYNARSLRQCVRGLRPPHPSLQSLAFLIVQRQYRNWTSARDIRGAANCGAVGMNSNRSIPYSSRKNHCPIPLVSPKPSPNLSC